MKEEKPYDPIRRSQYIKKKYNETYINLNAFARNSSPLRTYSFYQILKKKECAKR